MLHRHATDALSLVFGIVFAGLTAVWLLNVTDVIDHEQSWLVGPVVLILAGAVGLAVALRPARPGPSPGPEGIASAPGLPVSGPTESTVTDDTVTESTEMDWPEEPTSP